MLLNFTSAMINWLRGDKVKKFKLVDLQFGGNGEVVGYYDEFH